MSIHRITVLHVTQVPKGGVRRHILSLLKHGDRNNVCQEIACPTDEDFASIVEPTSIKIHQVPMARSLNPVKAIQAARLLRRIIQQGSYDVVHLHSSIAGAIGRFVLSACRVPAVVYTPHCFAFTDTSASPTRLQLYRIVERICARYCSAIIAVSQGEMEKGLSAKIAPRESFVLIENGIERGELVCGNKDAVRRELGLPNNALIVGMVGKLDPQKGIATFLRAAAVIASHLPNTVFIIVGDEYAYRGYAQQCKELAKRLGIEKQTMFTGYRADATRIASCFDVAILTSEWEGLSYSLLECVGLGIPTVATDVSGVRQVIEDGVNGFVVPRGATCLIVDRVLLLLRDPQLRNHISTRSNTCVRNRFIASQMADRTFALYREILERRTCEHR